MLETLVAYFGFAITTPATLAYDYDPYLNRFLSPDPIVPSTGEGNNPNAIGYVANANYSALVVDYHENQFLEQLNQENRIRLEDPNARLHGAPTNPLAFDRYAYCFNNPVRYNDPSGHCPGCAVAVLGGVGFTISAPVLIIGGLVVVAGVVAYDTFAPGREQRHAEISAGLTSLTNQATNSLNAVFANQRNDENQEALVGLAKEAKNKGGVSEDEAQTLVDWGKEYKVPSRGPEIHPDRPFNKPHIHVGPVGHIPVIPK